MRLELLRLTKAVLEAQPSTVRDHVDPAAAILEKSSYDKFPDVKKLASEVTVWQCAQKEAVHLKDYCPGLNKALLLNLTHQQQKIRVAALQAVGAVVVLNSYFSRPSRNVSARFTFSPLSLITAIMV